MDLAKIERVLIIRLSSIGDVIHALPVSAALKKAYPHLHLTWIVEEMSAEIVRLDPLVDRVIVLPRSRWKEGRTTNPQVWKEYLQFLKELRKEKFDLSLDLQGYAKSGLMALAAGATKRIGWRKMRDGSGMISPPVPAYKESLHRVEWFLDVVRSLGIEQPIGEANFPLVPSSEAKENVSVLLNEGGVTPGTPYVVVNPAAGNLVRRWGAENYSEVVREIANRLALPCVLIGTARDAELNREVGRLSKAGFPQTVSLPLDLAGKTSLGEVVALLAESCLHICGDTGSAHISAALKIPVVAIYGPTDPTFAGPYGQGKGVLFRAGICGAECNAKRCSLVTQTLEGNEIAPCLSAITPLEVIQKATLRSGETSEERLQSEKR